MALYTVRGFIAQKDDIVSGQSASGRDWARQDILLDVPGFQGSTTKLALTARDARVETVSAFPVGAKVEIGFTAYAREWQGRWYNNVEIVNIRPADQPVQDAPRQAMPQAQARHQAAAPQGYPQQGYPQAAPAWPQQRINVSQVPQGSLIPQDDDLPVGF